MKLRNKNTGEIIDLDIANIKAQFGAISVIPEPVKLGGDEYVYHSLAELNSEWEDYTPSEPLIKDEKIRKAVRAWWEAVPDAITDKRVFYRNNQDLAIGVYTIYCGAIYPETLEVGKMYTIAELCGDEEE